MRLITPIKLSIPDGSPSVRKFLTYKDKTVDFAIMRHKKSLGWQGHNREAWTERLNELKSEQHKCLLFEDEDGFWTYSGLHRDLSERFNWELKDSELIVPEGKLIPWKKIPFTPHYYQQEAIDAMVKAEHGAISLPTGSGKSLILIYLAKHYGLKTLITTPSTAITKQLYADFVAAFGTRYVGKYGAGTKVSNKLFTIATAKGVSMIKPDTKAFEDLSECEVFMFDESHQCPAETFRQVCTGVAAKAKYRFFVSATQMRNDGSELLLRGITGPIVYEKPFTALVEQGFLAKPVFKMFCVPSTFGGHAMDTKLETRKQLYKNPHVNELAADIANKSVTLANRPTVIIVEEFTQFVKLIPHLTVPFEFVHGGTAAKYDPKTKLMIGPRKILEERYWKSDTQGAIDRFNSGETKLLIGTSAIATGVDLRPTQCLIYMQGGLSEIKVRQAIGRGTRIVGVEGKKDCWVVDFKVIGSQLLERHANSRKDIYSTMYEVTEYGQT